ncbi:alpha/beta hydrolase [Betaproteobacteria bacterium PRO7]|nr:alpha/beta hydrolase [Burkholderiaceae bacterium]MDL1860481.1 alpha/beta hydrolase [Betaproteobacteria bacterium PRO7]
MTGPAMVESAPIRACLVALAASVLAGCNMIEGMFFYPDRVQYTRPADYGLAYEDVALATADGVKLHAWWLPAQGAAAGTVLHLHGNAANVSNHLPLAAWLPRAGFNVLMLDYRGFGRSEGRPTLDGVLEDARAALAHLRSRRDVDATKLIVFGQSLGGATALRLLAEDAAGVRLAVIDSAFASYRGIARDAALQSIVLAPFLPLALPLLPGADKDPVTALARIDVPLIFVHGRADRVIPFKHSEQLLAAAQEPKRLIAVERAQHMESVMRPDVQSQVLAAMRDAVR